MQKSTTLKFRHIFFIYLCNRFEDSNQLAINVLFLKCFEKNFLCYFSHIWRGMGMPCMPYGNAYYNFTVIIKIKFYSKLQLDYDRRSAFHIINKSFWDASFHMIFKNFRNSFTLKVRRLNTYKKFFKMISIEFPSFPNTIHQSAKVKRTYTRTYWHLVI